MPESQRAFFKKYCIACHNAEKKEGMTRLDDIPFGIDDEPTADRWQKVLGALNSGEMPPENEMQPKPEEKLEFLEALSKQMVVARKSLADTGGRITMRRLNRREYVNTIHDLLDVEVNALELPSDEQVGTFDTVGADLFFSSDQFEQYLKLARTALDSAIVTGPRPERKVVRIECEEQANKQMWSNYDRIQAQLRKLTEWKRSGRPATEFGYGDDNAAGLAGMALRGGVLRASQYLEDPLTRTGAVATIVSGAPILAIPGSAPPGQYVIRARFAFASIEGEGQRFVELGAQGDRDWPHEMRLLGCFPSNATLERPDMVEVSVRVTTGGNRQYAIRERRHNTFEAKQRQERFVELGVPMDTRHRREFMEYPKLWVDWMEWDGPLIDRWPPRSHRAVFGDANLGEKPGVEEARTILTSFAERAFRGRPVRPEFVNQLVGHFEERIKAGEPFFQAIKTPLAIILASPRFLYIIEPTVREQGIHNERAPQTPVSSKAASSHPQKRNTVQASQPPRLTLTDIELANRLSYFLWAGPPDSRLMMFVDTGRLGTPNILSTSPENEVDRLLADPRSNRFIEGFMHQWLHMIRLDFFRFNPRLYPKFDESLRRSARREVFETVRRVLDEDLPVGALLKSDFVVVDDLLADYYGVDRMQGSSFRKVRVPDAVPRGGLLGMAAILAMGSDGERSSPVERGAWVLRKLLNDPPPPAPANVPQLSRFGDKLMPGRELITAHQEQPQCATCHRHIDPIGFALQNFDAAGLWRDQEYAEFYKVWSRIEKKELFPIDPSGRLPNGRQFVGFYGLRDAVAAHEDDFARGLIENLVEYALGRPCGFSDAELVESIFTKAKSKGMTLRTIIHAIVESREFRSK